MTLPRIRFFPDEWPAVPALVPMIGQCVPTYCDGRHTSRPCVGDVIAPRCVRLWRPLAKHPAADTSACRDRNPASAQPVAAPNGGASRNSSPGTLDRGGWARLAEGRYSQALSIFAAEASNRPNAGRPKVGYALSTAACGDLRRGVWAMRRALRIDPKSMHYMTIEEPLRPRVVQLITRYRDSAGPAVRNAEAAFMLASLHSLLGDTDSARTAIDRAVADGDHSSGAGNLKRLIVADLTPDTQHERRAEIGS